MSMVQYGRDGPLSSGSSCGGTVPHLFSVGILSADADCGCTAVSVAAAWQRGRNSREEGVDEVWRGAEHGARGRGNVAASMVQRKPVIAPLSKLMIIYHANSSS